jgi:hypothetical protein
MTAMYATPLCRAEKVDICRKLGRERVHTYTESLKKQTHAAMSYLLLTGEQGCQMVCFQTKNPNLGKFWRVLHWKMLVYFMETWSILMSFVMFYGHLV